MINYGEVIRDSISGVMLGGLIIVTYRVVSIHEYVKRLNAKVNTHRDKNQVAITVMAEQLDAMNADVQKDFKFAIKPTPYSMTDYTPPNTIAPIYPAPDDFSEIDAARTSKVQDASRDSPPESVAEPQTTHIIGFAEPLHKPLYAAEGK